MQRPLFWLLTALLTLGACSSDDGTLLVVHVRTDLAPGVEFSRVRTIVVGEGPGGLDLTTLFEVDESADPLAGLRVAELEGLSSGPKVLRLALLGAGDVTVAERPLQVRLSGRTAVTVTITRDCSGVECPTATGDPNATACLGGRCVLPECTAENVSACGTFECREDSECVPATSCALGACADGVCLFGARPGACPGGQWCEPERGCLPIDGMDAGMDASMDAGRDAGPDALLGPTYVDLVMEDAPVAYWRLGEQVPPVAVDSGPNGYDGTYTGGVLHGEPGAICGDSDTAARFQGGDDRIDMGDVLDFAGTVPFTIEFWLSPGASGGGVLAKNSYDSSTANWEGYWITLHDTSPTTRLLRVHRANGTGNSANTDAPPADQYSHIVATWDGVTRVTYINGVQAATRTSSVSLLDIPEPFVLGDAQGWPAFMGTLDEVAVYDRVLPVSRIVAHYERGIRCD